MKFLKWLIALIIIGLIFMLGYGYYIEPHELINNKIEITKTKGSHNQLKIVQFSDVHIRRKTKKEDLDKLVTMVNEQKPDVIIFTGDLYDNYNDYHDNKLVETTLGKMHAKYGKIAVYGNHDSGGGSRYYYPQIMAKAGFDVLVNQKYTIQKDDKTIVFYGLDDSLLGQPAWAETKGDYRILISHEPELSYQTDEDLVLSGHTHGGQIRLPFISGKTNLMGDYVRGLYQQKGQYHYIDSGVGMTRLPFRLGVPPQISTITIWL